MRREEMIDSIIEGFGERIKRTGVIMDGYRIGTRKNAELTPAQKEERMNYIGEKEAHDLNLCDNAISYFAVESDHFVNGDLVAARRFCPASFEASYNGFNFDSVDHNEQTSGRDSELRALVGEYARRFKDTVELSVVSYGTPQPSPRQATGARSFALESEETKGGR